MDVTAPSHQGLQVWHSLTGLSTLLDAVVHTQSELYVSEERMSLTVRLVRDVYRSAADRRRRNTGLANVDTFAAEA